MAAAVNKNTFVGSLFFSKSFYGRRHFLFLYILIISMPYIQTFGKTGKNLQKQPAWCPALLHESGACHIIQAGRCSLDSQGVGDPRFLWKNANKVSKFFKKGTYKWKYFNISRYLGFSWWIWGITCTITFTLRPLHLRRLQINGWTSSIWSREVQRKGRGWMMLTIQVLLAAVMVVSVVAASAAAVLPEAAVAAVLRESTAATAVMPESIAAAAVQRESASIAPAAAVKRKKVRSPEINNHPNQTQLWKSRVIIIYLNNFIF